MIYGVGFRGCGGVGGNVQASGTSGWRCRTEGIYLSPWDLAWTLDP